MATFAAWRNDVSAHIENKSGVKLEDIPESGPMPFDWPDLWANYDAGTPAADVADHILWCAGFPGAVPVL
jgi:hypothetical protein